MKQITSSIIATLVAAGIIANVTFFYSFGQRLARIEAKLENLEARKLAQTP